jgi:iron complex transport system substrate-binding protein
MSRWHGWYALILLSWCSIALPASESGAAVTVRDDSGREVGLKKPARRIVALAPFLTELAFAGGSGDLLVGVSAYSDYPDAASALPRVGDAYGLDLERVLSLGPDLVLAWASGNGATQIDRLRQLGLTVYVSEPQRLHDVESTLERLGVLTGRQESAHAAAVAFRTDIDALRARYADQPTVRVFYELWHQPWITVGGSHLISDVIELCGGHNVFGDVAELAPVVDIEAIVARDPQVILVGADADQADSVRQRWARWMLASAVRESQVYVVAPELLQRQTTRVSEGATRACELIARARK